MTVKIMSLQDFLKGVEDNLKESQKNRQYPFIPFTMRNPPEGKVVTCKLKDGSYKDFYFIYQRVFGDDAVSADMAKPKTRRIPMNANGTRCQVKPDLLEWVELPTWIRQEFQL